MFQKTNVKYKNKEKYDQYGNGLYLFLNNLTIERCFIIFTSITSLFSNYKCVGLYPIGDEDKSVGLTVGPRTTKVNLFHPSQIFLLSLINHLQKHFFVPLLIQYNNQL